MVPIFLETRINENTLNGRYLRSQFYKDKTDMCTSEDSFQASFSQSCLISIWCCQTNACLYSDTQRSEMITVSLRLQSHWIVLCTTESEKMNGKKQALQKIIIKPRTISLLDAVRDVRCGCDEYPQPCLSVLSWRWRWGWFKHFDTGIIGRWEINSTGWPHE